ncbi:hypothetical protein ACC759_38040, partial [Rhizobium ruizarguesonis]
GADIGAFRSMFGPPASEEAEPPPPAADPKWAFPFVVNALAAHNPNEGIRIASTSEQDRRRI